MNFDPSEWEPLLDDDRVERLAGKIRSQYGHRKLADTTFFTFIQPARQVKTRTSGGIFVETWVPEMAVFAAITPRPQGRPGQRLMTTATVSLADWRESEADVGHYAGAPDEAHKIFRLVAVEQISKIQSAKEMIQ